MFRNQDLAELAACIDWGPFFQTWDLAGRFPEILRDEVVGAEAQRVFSDGKRLLQRLIEGRWLQASGVITLLPANTVDDDTIEVYRDETRSEVVLRWNPLRLQTVRPVIDGVPRPNRCLADFIAPKGVAADYIGRGYVARHRCWQGALRRVCHVGRVDVLRGDCWRSAVGV